MHCSRFPHWVAVKFILCYLNNTRHLAFYFSAKSSHHVSIFSNADWIGCSNDRRSTGWFCVYFGSHLILWDSKKQSTIAQSSTEAEYKSLANTTYEFLWLQFLIKELGIFLSSTSTLWCDNIDATYLSMNLVMHVRTKKYVELTIILSRKCGSKIPSSLLLV